VLQAAKADAEAARVERENHLEIAVHCNRELLQQLQLPWVPPEQVIVSFRRGNTAGMLLEKVSQTLQKLCPEAADNTSVGRSLLLSADTAQVCLLDVKENIVRLRWSADSPLDPKALLDSRRGGSTPFVYFLDQAPKGDREGGGWFFGDGDPPCTELAVLNPKDRYLYPLVQLPLPDCSDPCGAESLTLLRNAPGLFPRLCCTQHPMVSFVVAM